MTATRLKRISSTGQDGVSVSPGLSRRQGVLVGVAGMVAGASLFPLKSSETFLVVVDKETGEVVAGFQTRC